MKKSCFALLIVLLTLVGIPCMVQANIVSYTFEAPIIWGYREGDFGTGSFSFDDSLLSMDTRVLGPADGISITFSFDGQDFNQTNDKDFDRSPNILFHNTYPIYLEYSLVDGQNGVAFNDSDLFTLYIRDLTPSIAGYDYQANMIAKAYAPIPGAVWLLVSGIAGLAGIRRRYGRPL